MMQETKEIDVEGRRLRILDAGEGPVTVVLHGWGGRIESMAPVISCLSSERRVVAIDLPGFGESPPPQEVWGTPEYAALVASVLDLLGTRRASFVGHSFGAKTSLCLATLRPELVDRLIVVGSPGIRKPPSLKARAKRWASRGARFAGRFGGPGRRLRDAVFDRVASRDYKDAGPMRPVLVKVVNEDLSELLPRVSAPTLLVWGTEDDAVPVAHARIMERLIPDAGLVLFEGAGHFAYLDEPDRFCRVAKHFLKVAMAP